MPTINGVPVNFGFTGSLGADKSQGITITGVSGVLLQSADQTKVADREVARNGTGDKVTSGHYDIHDQGTLSYIVTGTDIATAIANTVLQTPGTLLVVSACASMPSLVATTWEVLSGAKLEKTNTGFAKVTIPIEKNPNITAAAS